VLKIARTATDSEIREAYLARAKSYHADRFANIDLPLEVQEYTNSMSRRINEAYAILNAGKTQRMQQPDQTVYGQAG
jgi:curved DNA-binding protein CbpA